MHFGQSLFSFDTFLLLSDRIQSILVGDANKCQLIHFHMLLQVVLISDIFLRYI